MRKRGRCLARQAFAIAAAAFFLAPVPLFSFPAEKVGQEVTTPRIPLSFIENAGQLTREDIRYYTAAGDVHAAFTDTGVLLSLSEPRRAPAMPREAQEGPAPRETLLRITFEGAEPSVPETRDLLPTRNHFFLGNDPARWRRDVPSFGEVAYHDLYESIDLVYRADAAGLKYEFLVYPGADPAAIAVRYEGALALFVDDAGDLIASTALGAIRDTSPRSFQGSREVACRFVLRSPDTAGFDCGNWNPREVLVIDPLVYATYLGGVGGDVGYAVAVDGSGNAYVAGETGSSDFPATVGAPDTSLGGASEAFVAKLNAAGSALLWATYLGGSAHDAAFDIALDASGNAYVAGNTESNDFPTTPLAFDTSYNGGTLDGFVAEISASGSALLYSTFLGGGANPFFAGDDTATSIALSASGAVYVTGYVDSPDFPVTPMALQPFNAGGTFDGFLAKLTLASLGPADLVYSTYLGGSGWDRGWAVGVDSGGNAYVAGDTGSGDFPTTSGALDTTYNGGFFDGFVAKVNPAGGGVLDLVYGTFLGGGGFDAAYGLAVDGSGNAYVAGFAQALSFPVTAGAYDTSYNGGLADAFAAKLNAAGSALAYATYLGGSGTDFGMSAALDGSGNLYLTGDTGSADFPVTPGAVSTTQSGTWDAVVARLDATGSTLAYSTFLGGSFDDNGRGIAVDSAGAVYVTGFTTSSDFPATAGAFDGTANGSFDAFVAKIGLPTAAGGVPCRTQGYWKNHPSAWPVASLTLGAATYTQAQLLTVLGTSTRGDASLILAHQLIAAKLNVAAGSNPAAAASTISTADSLLSAFSGSLPYGVKPSSTAGQAMVAAASLLDDYNNGRLTPSC